MHGLGHGGLAEEVKDICLASNINFETNELVDLLVWSDLHYNINVPAVAMYLELVASMQL